MGEYASCCIQSTLSLNLHNHRQGGAHIIPISQMRKWRPGEIQWVVQRSLWQQGVQPFWQVAHQRPQALTGTYDASNKQEVSLPAESPEDFAWFPEVGRSITQSFPLSHTPLPLPRSLPALIGKVRRAEPVSGQSTVQWLSSASKTRQPEGWIQILPLTSCVAFAS